MIKLTGNSQVRKQYVRRYIKEIKDSRTVQSIWNSKPVNAVKHTKIAQEVSGNIRGASSALKSGLLFAQKHNKSRFMGRVYGGIKLYRRFGIIPVITGAAGFCSAIPGGSTLGLTVGTFLKKGIKNLSKSNFAKSIIKVLKFIK